MTVINGKYILVEEKADPEGGCEIWLYDGPKPQCFSKAVVAVVNTIDRYPGDPAEGFHVAHTCRPHGEYLINLLNGETK